MAIAQRLKVPQLFRMLLGFACCGYALAEEVDSLSTTKPTPTEEAVALCEAWQVNFIGLQRFRIFVRNEIDFQPPEGMGEWTQQRTLSLFEVDIASRRYACLEREEKTFESKDGIETCIRAIYGDEKGSVKFACGGEKSNYDLPLQSVWAQEDLPDPRCIGKVAPFNMREFADSERYEQLTHSWFPQSIPWKRLGSTKETETFEYDLVKGKICTTVRFKFDLNRSVPIKRWTFDRVCHPTEYPPPYTEERLDWVRHASDLLLPNRVIGTTLRVKTDQSRKAHHLPTYYDVRIDWLKVNEEFEFDGYAVKNIKEVAAIIDRYERNARWQEARDAVER